MKKFFTFCFLVIFLLAAGAAVFFLTFDANRYKDLISSNLEKVLGKPVAIGHVGLKWQNGIAFEISKLAVYSDSSAKSAAGLQLDSASASIKFLPLLQKNIQVASIVLDKPVVLIDRGRDGSTQISGIDFSKKSSAPQAPASLGGYTALPFALSIDSVAIRGGRILFHDLSGAAPVNIEIKDLDLNVKNFSLTKPFTFEAAASAFSDKQNIKISGKTRLPQGTAPAALENLAISTDLNDLDIQKLSSSFPAMASGIREKRGNLSVLFDHLDLSPQVLDTAKGKLTFKNGRLVFTSFNLPIDSIDAAAMVGGNELRIDHLSAVIAGGTIQMNGTVKGITTQPVLAVKGLAKELSLDQFIQNVNPRAPQLNGHVTLDFEGQAQGLAWPVISKTLNGRARITMNDGVLLNYNILKEIISKISMIPGAEDAFKSNFPQMYQRRMDDKSTLLKPVDMTANIVNGVFIINPIHLETDIALIHGAGQVGLDRHLQMSANLVMNPEISKACAAAFSPVQLLFDNYGEVLIPVTADSELPQVKIVPDTKYITSKLLSGKAQEVLSGLVKDPDKGLSQIQNILKKNLKI